MAFFPTVGDTVVLVTEGQSDTLARVVEAPGATGTFYVVETMTGTRRTATWFELREVGAARPRLETQPSTPSSIARVVTASSDRATICEQLLDSLGVDYDRDTPSRMARAIGDLVSGYAETDFGKLLKTFPLAGDPGVVVVRDMPFASLCEHHVLPFTGTASVAYLPSDRIVGLSKIPRLLRAVSRRLQVQERIGVEVADAILRHVNAIGVLVVLRGRHSCMALRGAESPGEMVTSCARGVLLKDASARAEALDLMR